MTDNWLEVEDADQGSAAGSEPSSEQSEALDLSSGERRLVTQPYDLGVKGIVDDIDQGRISLNIEYQRQYIWDRGKASRLIESLLLNVPIPVCYFAEDDAGVYEVIDGLQRLTTIADYLRGEFALTGLPVLKELDGKKHGDLAPRDRRRLENRTIRCIVITEDSHPDIKFDVFERLNTGAAMLTAQELRNSVYRGPYNDSLKRIAEDESFTNMLGSSGSKRMELEELLLRFFALMADLQGYKPPLRQFLNTHMRQNRQTPADPQLVQLFKASCETVSDVLGSAPFRVPGSKNVLNKAMFDAVMVPVARADQQALREHAAEFKALMEILPQEERFITAIGRATADKQRMLYRVGRVADGIRSFGVHVDLPEGLGLDAASGSASDV
ncbi:DUF262 domain-containing protein [Paenarthrobacter nicotinovorans]|uniref:DUF262 domain-containing protein n=1 Tax=Paenarthrobacter nicotinovorans TaxID=29320 RepID=UPI001642F7A3|nr:DUF262 domain-containing protein [Paenarthrobacter nicotinovorans]